ncbi:MAG: BTAD domain-containing putative transcriptional regulator [Acidimicrobiia bacterium]
MGSEHSTPDIAVGVLGPLVVHVLGEEVEVPGPKRRAALALLAEAGGRTVTPDSLVDALWPELPPNSARSTLQSHISRIRRHLGATDRLEGSSAGYRLQLDRGAIDADAAAALLVDAADATPERAVEALAKARALWRGVPLAEFADVAPLAAWATRLESLRRAIDESYVTAALACGQHERALDAAAAAVVENPLSQRAVIGLMRALAATGRPAEALRIAYEHRQRLLEETGLDTSDELRALESSIATSTRPTRGAVTPPDSVVRGRDAELTELRRLLDTERLVTIVGPGGVGKTTLARATASRIEPATAVALTSVSPKASIAPSLAEALDLQVTRGDVLHACAALLAAGPRLLLLDGCEHVHASARATVTLLLEQCPDLTILATSREPLGLPAEHRLRLDPLALDAPASVDELASSPAAALFVDRARRADPTFALGPDELDLAVDIVRRLEGMPLAIELAAGRLATMGIADLHARLDRALDVLDGGEITLRQTIAWSYDLLPDDEQLLFRHLAAFPDGADLRTVETIAADLGLGEGAHRLLTHLVAASMVVREPGPQARYRLLDVVRAFGNEQLVAHGERARAQARFLQWAADLAEWVDSTIDSEHEAQVDIVLRRELANLRAAWATIRTNKQLDDAIHLVTALNDAAGWRDLTEVWAWALELAADPALVGDPHEAEILGIAATSAWARGELDDADDLTRRGLAVGGAEAWRCTAATALIALSRGDFPTATEAGARAGEAASRPEQSFGVAALAATYGGELQRATELADQLLTVAASPALRAFNAYVNGEIEALQGNTQRAEDCYQRAISEARTSRATFVEGIASVGLLTVLAASGKVDQALAGYREIIPYWERTGAWVQQWTTLRNLARLLAGLGDERAAVFLDAAADAAADAPPITTEDRGSTAVTLDASDVATITSAARTATRAQVLAVAHAAIDELLEPAKLARSRRSR